MHIYFATKGIKFEVDEFINQLSAKFLPWKWRKDKDSPLQDATLQLSVRPIQLWEVGFPKEHYDLVATTIFGKGGQEMGLTGNDGEKVVKHTWLNKFLWGIRKALHLNPVYPYKEDFIMPVRKNFIQTIPIGTKEDYMLPEGYEGI